MSEYHLQLRRREEKIRVTEIVEQFQKGSAGLPGMVIKDQKGRTHTLMAVDFVSFDWVDIKVGSTIVVRIEEEIRSAHLLKELTR